MFDQQVIHTQLLREGMLVVYANGEYAIQSSHGITFYLSNTGPQRFLTIVNRVVALHNSPPIPGLEGQPTLRVPEQERATTGRGTMPTHRVDSYSEGVPEHMLSGAGRGRRAFRRHRFPEAEQRYQERHSTAMRLGFELGQYHAYLRHLIDTQENEARYERHIFPGDTLATTEFYQVPSELQSAINAGLIIEEPGRPLFLADRRPGDDIVVQLANEFPGFLIQYNNVFRTRYGWFEDLDLLDKILTVIDILTLIIDLGGPLVTSLLRRGLRRAVVVLGRSGRTIATRAGTASARRVEGEAVEGAAQRAGMEAGEEAAHRSARRSEEALARRTTRQAHGSSGAGQQGRTGVATGSELGIGRQALQSGRTFTAQEAHQLRQFDPPNRSGVMEGIFGRYPKLSLDPDTIREIGMLIRSTRRDIGTFLGARSAAGELRVLNRIHRWQAITEIRLLRPAQEAGSRTPDIQFRLTNDPTWYDIEVRTYTGARPGVRGRARGQTLPDRGNPNALRDANLARTRFDSGRLARSFREKIDHGQVDHGVIVMNIANPPRSGTPLLSQRQRQNLLNYLIQHGENRVQELWLILPNSRVELVAQLPGSNLFQRIFSAM